MYYLDYLYLAIVAVATVYFVLWALRNTGPLMNRCIDAWDARGMLPERAANMIAYRNARRSRRREEARRARADSWEYWLRGVFLLGVAWAIVSLFPVIGPIVLATYVGVKILLDGSLFPR